MKIHTSQVHPLDHNSVPYNFSSTISPLLHNAARALNLPARSQENFASAFNLPKSNGNTSSRSMKSETGENIPPIDTQYTGQILVSGYSICFVLPKIFLSHRREGGNISDNDDDPPSRNPATRRRLSIGERNQAQFMAAVDMWVPFICRPPRSPYLVCYLFVLEMAFSLTPCSFLFPVLGACITISSCAYSLPQTLLRHLPRFLLWKKIAQHGILPPTHTLREVLPLDHVRTPIHISLTTSLLIPQRLAYLKDA